MFLAGPGLFLPLEQEISRALAERRARNQGGVPVVRRAATIGVGLGLGVLVLLIATARCRSSTSSTIRSCSSSAWRSASPGRSPAT